MEKPNIQQLPAWARPLYEYVSGDEREAREQAIILDLIAKEGEKILTRDCEFTHMTASSIIVNPDRTKTLMAFHKIYNSWRGPAAMRTGKLISRRLRAGKRRKKPASRVCVFFAAALRPWKSCLSGRMSSAENGLPAICT